MRVGFLGAGTWGFCLSLLLVSNGHEVICWTRNSELKNLLSQGKEHPHLPGFSAKEGMQFTTDLFKAINGVDFVAEAVTAAGIRPLFEMMRSSYVPGVPIVMTSKGIEQDTGLILPEIACQVLGTSVKPFVGLLSGPGYAKEVIANLPTSVVASAYNPSVMAQICTAFTTPTFRVYPNADIVGIAYGGALKNIIAIACGISEGLRLGSSAKAALMTRGLHEIRKLALACGAKQETLYGLSGMGDLSLTCCSMTSRNTQFGFLLASGMTPKQATVKIDMVVEGAYTCISAMQLSRKHNISMPITESIYKILYENMLPRDAVFSLMQRVIKEEHL